MNKLTFYEQVGIVIPGSMFVFGLLLLFPTLQTVLTKDGISLGDFGIFLLLSYAAGQLIAAIGNAAESILWPLAGGMRTGWITKTEPELLSAAQIDLLDRKLEERLGIKGKVRGICCLLTSRSSAQYCSAVTSRILTCRCRRRRSTSW